MPPIFSFLIYIYTHTYIHFIYIYTHIYTCTHTIIMVNLSHIYIYIQTYIYKHIYTNIYASHFSFLILNCSCSYYKDYFGLSICLLNKQTKTVVLIMSLCIPWVFFWGSYWGNFRTYFKLCFQNLTSSNLCKINDLCIYSLTAVSQRS